MLDQDTARALLTIADEAGAAGCAEPGAWTADPVALSTGSQTPIVAPIESLKT